MIINRFTETLRKPILMSVLIIIAVSILGGFRIMHYMESPDVVLLVDRAGAQWIRYDSEFVLEAKPAGQTECRFKYFFNTDKKIDNARITIQALRKCQIFFDNVNIFSSDYEFNKWKQVNDIKIPFTVKAGPHEIIIAVTSENSYPAVIAYSNTMPVKTGSGWLASNDGRNWQTAVPASQIEQPAMSKKFPSSREALAAIFPYLTFVFVIALIVSLFTSWPENKDQKFFHRMLEPSYVRWGLLLLWATLAINNIFRLNFQVGSDVLGHIEYIEYLVTKGSLPLASDGWEMYQPPLNYILSAPLYALLIKWFDLPSVVKIMGIIPVTCGLLQIEIVYRAARLVFVERKDLQIIAIVTGAFLPIHTYVCQAVGNEPLAACFMSLVILLCLSLIMPAAKERQWGYFVLIGFLWGLALLSKLTALLLAPVLVAILFFYTSIIKKRLSLTWKPVIIVFCVSIFIVGWYYLINYIEFGNPFGGTFVLRKMLKWWQDPSYRTWSQILSFGQSLVYPVYSGVVSFWDTLYSTLWLDGFNSGLIDFIPWNENFMVAGALLALLPSMFILTGIVSIWLNKKTVYRNAVIFSICTIGIFVAIFIDFYIRFPIYSTAKASYTLGLLPCYAILVAAGAEPFFRNRIIRCLAIALFSCWAFAAYVAYFVVKYQ